LLKIGGAVNDANAGLKFNANQHLFGSHEMAGNVLEGVQDCWHNDYVNVRAPCAAGRGIRLIVNYLIQRVISVLLTLKATA